MNLGFIGVGNIALEHAEVAQSLGHKIRFGSATTIDSPRWSAFSACTGRPTFEPDVHALLNHPELDAIIACLPWNVTERWLPTFLSSAKPILIEKPLALSVAALERALVSVNAQPENKVIGFNRRFYKPVQRLLKRLQEGGIKSVEITISEAVNRLVSRYGDQIIPHILVYSSCHILDTAYYLLGTLHPIKIYRHKTAGPQSSFDSISALLETDSGAPVHLSIMSENPIPIGIRILFDDGTTWHLSPMERLTAYEGYQVIEPSPGENIRRYSPCPFLVEEEDAKYKPGFVEQMRAFLGGGVNGGSPTLIQHIELLKLIESLEHS